jgi:hypothetical protein
MPFSLCNTNTSACEWFMAGTRVANAKSRPLGAHNSDLKKKRCEVPVRITWILYVLGMLLKTQVLVGVVKGSIIETGRRTFASGKTVYMTFAV